MTLGVVLTRTLPPAQIVCDEYDELRATIELSGEIDVACAETLRAELERHARARRRVVRIDTYAVTFMDSVVLGVLVDAHRQWLAMRGTLVLIGVTGPTKRLLELARVHDELLCMPPTANMALRAELVHQ
jgi:anti-sigma B factor antagonist